MAQLLLKFVAGGFGHTATFFGNSSTLAVSLWMLLSRQIGSGTLCQHIEDELRIGHVITQTLFLQALELLVLTGGLATPLACNNVSK